jgi:hypothetical protein
VAELTLAGYDAISPPATDDETLTQAPVDPPGARWLGDRSAVELPPAGK